MQHIYIYIYLDICNYIYIYTYVYIYIYISRYRDIDRKSIVTPRIGPCLVPQIRVFCSSKRHVEKSALRRGPFLVSLGGARDAEQLSVELWNRSSDERLQQVGKTRSWVSFARTVRFQRISSGLGLHQWQRSDGDVKWCKTTNWTSTNRVTGVTKPTWCFGNIQFGGLFSDKKSWVTQGDDAPGFEEDVWGEGSLKIGHVQNLWVIFCGAIWILKQWIWGRRTPLGNSGDLNANLILIRRKMKC